MAVPPIAKATLQAALISAGSNVLAQGIKSYRADQPRVDEKRLMEQRGLICGTRSPFELDVESLTQFATCAIVISPLGYLWLGGLESWFPGRESKGEKGKGGQSTSEPGLNATNTVAKIVIDQTIGGAWNTVLFITTMGMLRGMGYDAILAEIQEDFWSIMFAGLKFWPLVSILNFAVVPANRRMLVGNLFGVLWGIYLSLLSG
ncbi:hypothetical protein N7541_003223 [Penicillium brevicompactum]|uniref:Uncharacterized protein n=1 Tax=Penicillium brevicompactum TaxID=5074 RepID=A0A9W9UZM6_PENBR|nr:hypothetical protein N7541_003223 [Penicillium brevicompactum]